MAKRIGLELLEDLKLLLLGMATTFVYNYDPHSWQATFYPSLMRNAAGSVDAPTFLRLGATQLADSYSYIFGAMGAIFVVGLVLGQRWGLQQVKRHVVSSEPEPIQSLLAE